MTHGRRNELTHPAYAKPEIKGPAKWMCFHLYVILDVFSRYVVGWMIAPRESAELAHGLIAATCDHRRCGGARGRGGPLAPSALRPRGP